MLVWLVMLCAWLIERFVPISSHINPIAFFRFICKRMAHKVLPSTYQTQQHYISGTLAWLSLIFPILAIAYIVSELASYSWLFSGIILYLCLQFSQETKKLKRIHSALLGNKKQLAKDYLSTSVLRDTQKLSTLGICKASIEMYILRLQYQQVVVLFCFAIAGPIAALFYRLSYEASQVWNVKLSKFTRFGAFSHFICRIIQFIPTRIFSLILNLMNAKLIPKQMFGLSELSSPNGRFILYSTANAMRKTLDGPVYYKDIKVRRERAKMDFDVQIKDIKIFITLCTGAMLVYFLVILVFSRLIT